MAKMEDPVRSLRAKMDSLMSRMVAMFVDASLRANFFALWRIFVKIGFVGISRVVESTLVLYLEINLQYDYATVELHMSVRRHHLNIDGRAVF